MYTPQQVDQNLAMLQELISCGDEVYMWSFDAAGTVLSSNCTDMVLNTIFEHIGCNAYMIEYGQTHTAPLVLGAPLGLMWCVAFEHQEGQLFRTHMLGPVFNTETSMRVIEDEFAHYQSTLSFKIELFKALPRLPVISNVLLYQYALMLHYCVTGEKLNRSDITLQESKETSPERSQKYQPKDRHKVYESERALLRMVREGDLDSRNVLNRAASLSSGVNATNGKPLEQAMVSCTTFVSLITRAAIEGGLSPESAYTLGDGYIQSIMQAKTVAEMGSITNTAYSDFVLRVHKGRQNPDVSPQVQHCCDYIELHLESDLSLKTIADEVGYTEYYLSRKFKKEVGVNLHEYIRFARIERAKTLLNSTELSVAHIAELLQFCSSSHFSRAFQSVTGLTPVQWKNSAR